MTTSIDERLNRIEETLFGTKMHTSIAVVQDKSSSMSILRDSTISGFNEYLADLKKEESDEASLTLIQFDTGYNVRYENKPVTEVADLNADTYAPGGMTALYDALGRAITELSRFDGSHERKLVVVMTDGQENSSVEYTLPKVKDLINEKQKAGNWTFVFLGAGIDKWVGQSWGIPVGNTFSYTPDAHSHSLAYSGLSTATSGLRSSMGAQSMDFTSNMTPDPDLFTPDKKEDDDETTN